MAMLFRIFLIYLIYLGIKSLLGKFLGPVKGDESMIKKDSSRKKAASQSDVIEAEYREIK